MAGAIGFNKFHGSVENDPDTYFDGVWSEVRTMEWCNPWAHPNFQQQHSIRGVNVFPQGSMAGRAKSVSVCCSREEDLAMYFGGQEGTVQAYQEKFEVLFKHVDLSEKEVVSQFIIGLKDEIQQSVHLFKPEILFHAISMAKLQEACLEVTKKKNKADHPLLPAPVAPFNPNVSFVDNPVAYDSAIRGDFVVIANDVLSYGMEYEAKIVVKERCAYEFSCGTNLCHEMTTANDEVTDVTEVEKPRLVVDDIGSEMKSTVDDEMNTSKGEGYAVLENSWSELHSVMSRSEGLEIIKLEYGGDSFVAVDALVVLSKLVQRQNVVSRGDCERPSRKLDLFGYLCHVHESNCSGQVVGDPLNSKKLLIVASTALTVKEILSCAFCIYYGSKYDILYFVGSLFGCKAVEDESNVLVAKCCSGDDYYFNDKCVGEMGIISSRKEAVYEPQQVLNPQELSFFRILLIWILQHYKLRGRVRSNKLRCCSLIYHTVKLKRGWIPLCLNDSIHARTERVHFFGHVILGHIIRAYPGILKSFPSAGSGVEAISTNLDGYGQRWSLYMSVGHICQLVILLVCFGIWFIAAMFYSIYPLLSWYLWYMSDGKSKNHADQRVVWMTSF